MLCQVSAQVLAHPMSTDRITQPEREQPAKPFLRWAGGKSWLVRRAEALFGPLEFRRYHEPFVGGGSFFFSLPSGTSAFLSDKNEALIGTYGAVRDDCERIIEILTSLTNDATTYYEVRSSKSECRFEQAAHFIFLNQTSFNGIYRVNLVGKYNVPYGYRTKDFVQAEILREASRRLATARLRSADFMAILDNVRDGDLVFIDPPYTVSHNKNGFIKYNQSLFSLEDQTRLATFVQEVRSRRAHYILTNAAHDAIEAIFRTSDLRIEVKRASLIGGKNAHRGATSEYLFTNLPVRSCQS
ncbi:MAG: Dam family site-specific DNA-(adenine-N6)-methyltransferase [Tepidisphaeraceae bacterium]